jgi:short-subunit dehydrogenase
VRVLALCPGATEAEFFARTGEEFLTDGRQTPKQVVDTAMAALDKSTPTIVPGGEMLYCRLDTGSCPQGDGPDLRTAAEGQLT